MRRSPKEIFQELRERIDQNRDSYGYYTDVFDTLRYIIEAEYKDILELSLFQDGVNATGLPDEFIADYMKWKSNMGQFNDMYPKVTHISTKVFYNDDHGWMIKFNIEMVDKI